MVDPRRRILAERDAHGPQLPALGAPAKEPPPGMPLAQVSCHPMVIQQVPDKQPSISRQTGMNQPNHSK